MRIPALSFLICLVLSTSAAEPDFGTLSNTQFHPLVIATDGTPQLAVRMAGFGYANRIPEPALANKLVHYGVDRFRDHPEFMMLKLWQAFAAGDLEAIVALHVPSGAENARAKYEAGIADVKDLHSKGQHFLLQKTLIGDYACITYATKSKGSERIWEETLVAIDGGYYFTTSLAQTSFPTMIMQSIAERQQAGATPLDAVPGMTAATVTVSGQEQAGIINLQPAKNPIEVAFRNLLAAPVELEGYAGSNTHLLFLAGMRQMYADLAPVEEINALWQYGSDRSYDLTKAIDPYAWYGNADGNLILAALAGPQGTIFIGKKNGELYSAFVIASGGTLRLAPGLLGSDTDTSNTYYWLDRLLRTNVLMLTVLGQ